MNEPSQSISAPLPTNGHTTGADKDDRPRIRSSSWSGEGTRGSQQITIGGLDSRELDAMHGVLHGHNWVTVSEKGRLRIIPTYKELPGPIDDLMMQPFWRRPVAAVETQLELFSMEPVLAYSLPSILIQHLCGYNYSHEGYQLEAKKLMRWGFECLRSRRQMSGQFLEIWFLPGLWAAKEELKGAIEHGLKPGLTIWQGDAKETLERAISFLCRNSSFGTLDACNQRAAMAID